MNPIETAGRHLLAGKSLAFSRYVGCLAATRGDLKEAVALYDHLQPRSLYSDIIKKSAIPAANTTDSNWAAPLAPLETLASAFIQTLSPRSIIGRMAGFRRVPFNISVPRSTSGTSVSWVGSGQPTMVTAMSLETVNFKHSKIAGIVVATRELVTSANPDATQLFHDDLSNGIVEFSDQQFLDPSVSEIVGVSPAAITNGAPSIASVGDTADAFAEDFKALVALIDTSLVAPFLIMRPTTAVGLAALDSQLTSHVGALGGTIGGIPVITSANVPSDADSPSDNLIVLVDAADIFLSDDGISITSSEHAILQMVSNPDSPVTASTEFISLWQRNLVAVMATRFVRWQRRRENSVAFLTGASY